MNKLYLMCGPPGCGKSTFAKEIKDAVYCSRDEVRFSVLKDSEDYFAHEDKVFKLWINSIKTSLSEGKNVVVDATHLNMRSRMKTLNRLDLRNTEVIACAFDVSLDICLERNAKHALDVPLSEDAIKSMYRSYELPNRKEFKYKSIYLIDKYGFPNLVT